MVYVRLSYRLLWQAMQTNIFPAAIYADDIFRYYLVANFVVRIVPLSLDRSSALVPC